MVCYGFSMIFYIDIYIYICIYIYIYVFHPLIQPHNVTPAAFRCQVLLRMAQELVELRMAHQALAEAQDARATMVYNYIQLYN